MNHPLIDRAVRWLTAASLLAGAVGMWLYVAEARDHLAENTALLHDVRADQAAIRKQLAEQTAVQTAIRTDQGRILDGQLGLAQSLMALAFDSGRHAAQHTEG